MSRQSSLFSHESAPASTRLVTAVGLTMVGFVAGQTASISYMAIPSIMEAPAPLLARQWKKLYDIGLRVGRSAYIAGFVVFGWLASQEPIRTPAFKLYLATAILMSSAVPYTLIFIKPTNDKLEQRAKSLASATMPSVELEAGANEEETTHALVDKWATLNMGRAVISITGSLCAVFALLSKVDVGEIGSVGLRN